MSLPHFPNFELKISMAIQGALIALIVGWLLRNVPPSEPARLWPYLALGYGSFAALFQWIDSREYHPANAAAIWPITLFCSCLVIISFSQAAAWLHNTPYRTLAWICMGVAVASVLSALTVVVMAVVHGIRQRGKTP